MSLDEAAPSGSGAGGLDDFAFDAFPFDEKYGGGGLANGSELGADEELRSLTSAAEYLLSGAGMGSEGESPDTSATPPTPTLQEDPLTTDGSAPAAPKRPNLTQNGDSVCKHCGKSFNSVWYLKQHAVKHSTERPFKCKFCHKTYRFRSNLYQHKCPDRDLFMGQRAARGLGGRGGRRKANPDGTKKPLVRMSSINERAIVTMPKEVQMTPTKAQGGGLQLDIWSAMEPPSLPSLPTPEGLAPTPVPPVEEPPRAASLDLEMGLTEAQVEDYITKFRTRLHRCPKCRLFFPTREHLMRHLASHSDVDGRFRCSHCSESFSAERELKSHRGKHSLTSPHVCRHCSGAFVSGLALRRHAAVCASLPGRPSATSPSQPLSFIDQSPPHPSSASDHGAYDAAGPSAPVSATTASAWEEGGGSGPSLASEGAAVLPSGDSASAPPPHVSPSSSVEMAGPASSSGAPASDSGYSSAASSQPSPVKAPGGSSDASEDLWEDDEPSDGRLEAPGGEEGGSLGLLSRSVTTRLGPRLPAKSALTARFLSPPPPSRRVLGESNGETAAPVPLRFLLPLFLPAFPCPQCGKALASETQLRDHLALVHA